MNKYDGNVREMMALFHVFDDFSEFNKRLIKYVYADKKKKLENEITKIVFVHGDDSSFKKSKFYLENKSIIDKFNQYSSIYDFIFNNYFRCVVNFEG